jgi:hypothetical protein
MRKIQSPRLDRASGIPHIHRAHFGSEEDQRMDAVTIIVRADRRSRLVPLH